MIIPSTDTLLHQAEQALARRDLAALLPYAEALEDRVTSPDDGQAVFNFFARLTREILFCPELHTILFERCLDALILFNREEGAEYLEKLLMMANGLDRAKTEAPGIVH